MRSLITLLPLCVALLSGASPLGDRALFRRHTGVPLARRFILSSRYDVPSACAAGNAPIGGTGNTTIPVNSTIPIPDSTNITDPTTPDNSTLTAPIAGDNSTVTDNSTLTDAPVDGNATTSADNSTAAVKRYGFYDFGDAWFDLCMNSGGDILDDSDPCFSMGIDGYGALLADADVCAQQEIADAMITFAKSRGVVNSADLIELAVSYRKLPRESVQIMGWYPSTPYCNIAPMNEEIMGICNEQPEGVTVGLYGGPNYPLVPFGDEDSCPYGQTPDVETCSCLSSFWGTGYTSPENSTVPAYATPDYGSPDDTSYSAAAEPIPTDVGSVSVAAPVETAASDSVSAVASSTSDAASSTVAAPVAAITGNFNHPDGR